MWNKCEMHENWGKLSFCPMNSDGFLPNLGAVLLQKILLCTCNSSKLPNAF